MTSSSDTTLDPEVVEGMRERAGEFIQPVVSGRGLRFGIVCGQFNGAILVARWGTIVYRKAFGKANFQTGSDFATETPSNIGSVTKQFTAMSIMILEEQKKLSCDDSVAKYTPEFSCSAHFSKITLSIWESRTEYTSVVRHK